MFKKSKRNFRSKKSDSEDESVEVIEVKPSTITSTTTTVAEATTSKPSKIESDINKPSKPTVLSFNLEEEEDEGETFKIKKSKESRRIAKEKKKERKNKDEDQSQQAATSTTTTITQTKQKIIINENSNNDSTNDSTIVVTENDEIILYNEGIKLKPLKTTKLNENLKNLTFKSEKAKIIEKYGIEEDSEEEAEKLRKLREEIDILNGGDADDLENETDDAKRQMKILLQTGYIPDSNMIHEARKRRELARQGGDFISIDDTTVRHKDNNNNSSKSRIIREDDNDLSEDDERISFNVLDKSNKEKQQTRDYFLAYEQGSDNEDEEEDVYERWEREQIKKGVQITQVMQLKKTNTGNTSASVLEKFIEYIVEPEPMDVEIKPEIHLNNLPKITFESIKENLKANINSYNETYRAHLNEINMIKTNYESSKETLGDINELRPKLNEQYRFYQEIKSYVADIVDCYNEKLIEIEKIESKWLNLLKQRSNRLLQRRQDDIKDQNTEYSLANSQQQLDENEIKRMMDTVQQRRTADRELRRVKRYKQRESSLQMHYDGLSSDDEENPSDITVFNQKKNDIMSKVTELFNDAIEDFYDINIIKSKFEEWRSKHTDTYEEAYVSLSLPKLFSPLVRLELIDWNPLETNKTYLDNKKWLKVLSKYNDKTVLDNEDDSVLVARIIEKTIFNRLIQIIENVYDPYSTKQTINLTSLISYLFKIYSTISSSQSAQKLIDAVVLRIRKTFDNDVFVPLFPKNIIDNKTSGSSIFFYRQFWSCVKLLGNVLEWNGILSVKLVQDLSLDCILNRYIMVALQYMDLNMETISKIEYIVRKFPQKWFENLEKNQTIPQLNNLCRFLKRIIDNLQKEVNDNKRDPKIFKENVRQIRKLFVSIQAMDHAIELTNTYQIK